MVERVVYGEGGILAGCAAGQVVVDLEHRGARARRTRIHGDLAERGVELVDAGISGGAAAAEQGTLTIMAGGSEQALDAVAAVPRDVLRAASTTWARRARGTSRSC